MWARDCRLCRWTRVGATSLRWAVAIPIGRSITTSTVTTIAIITNITTRSHPDLISVTPPPLARPLPTPSPTQRHHKATRNAARFPDMFVSVESMDDVALTPYHLSRRHTPRPSFHTTNPPVYACLARDLRTRHSVTLCIPGIFGTGRRESI